jgi:hypothetical protein
VGETKDSGKLWRGSVNAAGAMLGSLGGRDHSGRPILTFYGLLPRDHWVWQKNRRSGVIKKQHFFAFSHFLGCFTLSTRCLSAASAARDPPKKIIPKNLP